VGRDSPAAGQASISEGSFAFTCPVCRVGLEAAGPEELCCSAEGISYRRVEGIWRFLPPERLAHFEQFAREYETVRLAEGRHSGDPAYYRSLPFRDLTGCNAVNWRIRAKSFQTLMDRCILPMEAKLGRSLRVLDLGAGSGWLSYHLAKRGHQAAAVDLLTNDFDGLGAHIHYDAPFTPVQAEFDHLPFADGQADLAIFNASLHYATDYAEVLSEALRVLRPEGVVAIVDSPVYHDASSGARMVREREAQFQREYGFASNSIPSESYLTYDRLEELARQLDLKWQMIEPFYGWRWALRPLRARLRGRREPARFMVILGGRSKAEPPSSVPLWRFLTRWRYRLFERGRYDRLVLEEVAGRPILVLPGVFNPRLLRTGDILARTLDARLIPPGSTVLDMGTGSGIGAVFAAQRAGRVVAVDVNPAAVRCARINALLNQVEDRVEVLEGDLFAPVGSQRFDVVLFNPPYYRGAPRNDLDRAWRSTDVVERFASQLPEHVAPGGCALVVLSSDGERNAFLQSFRAAGLVASVVAERDLGNEVVTVYRLRVANSAAALPEGFARR